VPRLEIGDMAVINQPCFYDLKHYEKRSFGRTKWKDRDMFMGLRLMKSFRYILIDNAAGEVEFCGEGSFRADPNEPWPHYLMRVEPRERNLERLMVTIPLAGRKRKIMLDTGADCGMLVSAGRWKEFSAGLEIVKRQRGRVRMRDGWKKVTVMTVKSMDVGGKTVERAPIHVMDDGETDEDYLLLGMGYFTDTVIVLDFEHELLWVRDVEK